MALDPGIEKIELSLIRVLSTLITERSVSRAALKLHSSQPAVSAQLRRLRVLLGDPLLVRAGNSMAPTEVALQLLPVAQQVLQGAQQLFAGHVAARRFTPASAQQRFRVAASDYLDPLFLPQLVQRLQALAPGVVLDLLPLTRDLDYRALLGRGELDLVIGNWLSPPAELHLGRLVSDELVCLVAADHPAVRNPRRWTTEHYLAARHIAPAPLVAAGPGVVDEQLHRQGLVRHIAVHTPSFSLAPAMVARTALVLTTGRQFCARFVGRLPVRIVRCPVPLAPIAYYQLWHELTHAAAALRWLREQVRDVARELAAPAGPEAGTPRARASA